MDENTDMVELGFSLSWCSNLSSVPSCWKVIPTWVLTWVHQQFCTLRELYSSLFPSEGLEVQMLSFLLQVWKAQRGESQEKIFHNNQTHKHENSGKENYLLSWPSFTRPLVLWQALTIVIRSEEFRSGKGFSGHAVPGLSALDSYQRKMSETRLHAVCSSPGGSSVEAGLRTQRYSTFPWLQVKPRGFRDPNKVGVSAQSSRKEL